MPRFENFEVLNAWLEDLCLQRWGAVLRGLTETIGDRLLRDPVKLMVLLAALYHACKKIST